MRSLISGCSESRRIGFTSTRSISRTKNFQTCNTSTVPHQNHNQIFNTKSLQHQGFNSTSQYSRHIYFEFLQKLPHPLIRTTTTILDITAPTNSAHHQHQRPPRTSSPPTLPPTPSYPLPPSHTNPPTPNPQNNTNNAPLHHRRHNHRHHRSPNPPLLHLILHPHLHWRLLVLRRRDVVA